MARRFLRQRTSRSRRKRHPPRHRPKRVGLGPLDDRAAAVLAPFDAGMTAGVTVVWQVNERDNLRLSYHRDVSTSDLQPKTEELMVRYNWVSF